MNNKQKNILITQSNYIPWKGYFDAIAICDVFVVYDDMQFTKRDWRNRNMIKAVNDIKWLTIPVEVKGKFFQKINETKIAEKDWYKSHLAIIKQSYGKANSFKSHFSLIEELYMSCNYEYLTEINLHFIKGINQFLEINTEIKLSSDFTLHEERTQRLVDICVELQGTDYFSGPAAKVYMDETKFTDKNISVNYFDYSSYPEYEQINGAFTHSVSIIDLILSVGDGAKNYMKFIKQN